MPAHANLRRLVELATASEWPVEFVVAYAPLLGSYAFHRVVVGLRGDPEDDVDALRFRLEGAFPGEVEVRVLRRTEWARGMTDLDLVLLDAFQQGEPLFDRGAWSGVVAHFQDLADRGLIMKTRRGWRRPGDAPRDPDAEMLAKMFQALREGKR